VGCGRCWYVMRARRCNDLVVPSIPYSSPVVFQLLTTCSCVVQACTCALCSALLADEVPTWPGQRAKRQVNSWLHLGEQNVGCYLFPEFWRVFHCPASFLHL
jgi:hypothetical protein